MSNISRKILLFSLLLLLVSCKDLPKCLDPDDFGFNSLTISSRYDAKDISEISPREQITPWIDSGYRVDGSPLMIVTRNWNIKTGDPNNGNFLSAWCPWYGQENNKHNLSVMAARLPECSFIDGKMCFNPRQTKTTINNPPCIFKKGVGAYALIADRDKINNIDVDPNVSNISMQFPEGINFHLGTKPDFSVYEVDSQGNLRETGGVLYNKSALRDYKNSKLYFKIHDKHYDDNCGQYRILLKSGIKHKENKDPMQYIISLVKEYFHGAEGDGGIVKSFYDSIIKQSTYRFFIVSLLNLFILITFISYLIGNIQLTHLEIISRLIKIAIVSVLLNQEQSWSFFNDYLYKIFIQGIDEIKRYIAGEGIGEGANLISLVFSRNTIFKLSSLIFAEWTGIIYVILFIILIGIAFYVLFRYYILYIVAISIISMLIILAPIFIACVLFNFTRSWFENWLKQLITYWLQPIILYTGIIFMNTIIIHEIYASLGFPICLRNIFTMKHSLSEEGKKSRGGYEDLGSSIFVWWFPSTMSGAKFTQQKAKIPVPLAHITKEGKSCNAYECIESRYPDLPYLDPENENDMERIQSFHKGNYVQVYGLFIVFIAIYLLNNFLHLGVSIAEIIGGGGGNFSSSGTAGKLFQKTQAGAMKLGGRMMQYGGKALGVVGMGYGLLESKSSTLQKARQGLQNSMNKVKKYTSIRTLENYMEKAKLKQIEKGALKKGNQAVHDAVARDTGLKKTDINPQAIRNNEKMIKDILKSNIPNIQDKELDRKVKEFTKNGNSNGHQELKNYLSRTMWQKNHQISGYNNLTPYEKQSLQQRINNISYNDLSNADKKKIDSMMFNETLGTSKESMKNLEDQVNQAQEYKKAYMSAYQNLSEQNVGWLTKQSSSSAARRMVSYQKHKDQQNKKRQKAEDAFRRGEKIENLVFGRPKIDKEVNFDDPIKQTYKEKLLSERKDKIHSKKIKPYTNNKHKLYALDSDNNMSDERKELLHDDLRYNFKKYVTSPSKPLVKGNKYLQNNASDEEKISDIKSLIKAKQDFIKQDKYLSKENIYRKEATELTTKLDKEYNTLKNDLKDYYKIENDNRDQETEKQLMNRLKDYNDMRQRYDFNKNILRDINERKKVIDQETDQYIENITNTLDDKSKEENYYDDVKLSISRHEMDESLSKNESDYNIDNDIIQSEIRKDNIALTQAESENQINERDVDNNSNDIEQNLQNNSGERDYDQDKKDDNTMERQEDNVAKPVNEDATETINSNDIEQNLENNSDAQDNHQDKKDHNDNYNQKYLKDKMNEALGKKPSKSVTHKKNKTISRGIDRKLTQSDKNNKN